MLPPPLHAPLAVLITCVAAVSAVLSLTVRTSTSNVDVDRLENFKLSATITNTGDGTLKFLNDPRGMLNPFPENSFTITGSSGSRPPFTGDSADYNPVHAANLDHPDAFADVGHDLPAAYSFTQSGAGDGSVEPSNVFDYIDADGITKGPYATVEEIAKVKLSGDPAVSRNIHDKRVTKTPQLNMGNCHPEEESVVTVAIWGAESTFSEAYKSLKRATPGAYKTWFGVYESSRKAWVKANFKAAKDNVVGYAYRCGCDSQQEQASLSGVYDEGQHGAGTILLCREFFARSTDREAELILNTLGRVGLHYRGRPY